VDLENRGYRHGLFWCYPLVSFLLILLKSRYVPGSVDGIRKSLEWAGLNYDYGWSSFFVGTAELNSIFQDLGRKAYTGRISKWVDELHLLVCFYLYLAVRAAGPLQIIRWKTHRGMLKLKLSFQFVKFVIVWSCIPLLLYPRFPGRNKGKVS